MKKKMTESLLICGMFFGMLCARFGSGFPNIPSWLLITGFVTGVVSTFYWRSQE